MRLLVLGDIHANVEALTAVLEEARRIGYDRIVHTGDLIGYGPRPNETVDLVRSSEIQGVRGNFDENVAWGGESAGESGDEHAKAVADAALRWTMKRIGFAQQNLLKDLPFSIDQTAGERHVLICHASPTDLYLPIDEDVPDSVLREAAEGTDADVYVFGHTHRPFHRVLDGQHFVNAGSVGRPQDGDPRACLAVLELDGRVEVSFRRVTYDVERTAKEIEHSGLPLELAAGVRSGA